MISISLPGMLQVIKLMLIIFRNGFQKNYIKNKFLNGAQDIYLWCKELLNN